MKKKIFATVFLATGLLVALVFTTVAGPTNKASAAASNNAAASAAKGVPGIIGDITADSSKVSCAKGTVNLGVYDGYRNGKRVKIRLCAIPGMKSTSEESTPGSRFYIKGANHLAIVNSRVSGAVLAMFNAAKKSGLTMSAISTFRTYAHQKSLCPCDGISVARPGYSNHQMALAIDFAGPTVKNRSQSCSSRAKAPGSATWRWLSTNAKRFGYKQYSAESWHWDPFTMSNRC